MLGLVRIKQVKLANIVNNTMNKFQSTDVRRPAGDLNSLSAVHISTEFLAACLILSDHNRSQHHTGSSTFVNKICQNSQSGRLVVVDAIIFVGDADERVQAWIETIT